MAMSSSQLLGINIPLVHPGYAEFMCHRLSLEELPWTSIAQGPMWWQNHSGERFGLCLLMLAYEEHVLDVAERTGSCANKQFNPGTHVLLRKYN